MSNRRNLPKKVAAVDVFCGAAGLSYGLMTSGVKIVAGIDVDPDCRYPFEANIGAPFIHKDISTLSVDDVKSLFEDDCIRLLAGCAPCQPFSAYTTKRRSQDSRWRLLLDFMRLVEGVRPELITLENVPRLALMPLWSSFVGDLEILGYHVKWKVVDASRYGVPQSRRRLVLLASRLGTIDIPAPSNGPSATVRAAIESLPSLRAGDRSKVDPMHSSRGLSSKNLARIRQSRQAGTWRDWPEDMRAHCHVNGESRYPSVYGRMSWDKASPTITTQFYGFGNGRFGHPDQDRALSLREGAILQSFPRNYSFLESGRRLSFNRIGKLIGNAVPPALAAAIGRTIINHVKNHKYPLLDK